MDLLPCGYTFATDPDLCIRVPADGDEPSPPPSIFDLSGILGVSIAEFRQFLLEFLLENRRGRIFTGHTKASTTSFGFIVCPPLIN